MENLSGLFNILNENTCIVGIGNPYRNDDGVGVYICEELKTKSSKPAQIKILNVEDILESYVFQIADGDFKNILLVDAVRCGAEDGSIIYGKLAELSELNTEASTHKLSLSTTEKIFTATGKKVFFLGVAGNNLDYGSDISDPVKASADLIINTIHTQWSKQ